MKTSDTEFAVGDEVSIIITGVTNNRTYKSAGEILSIHGNLAVVRYKQPWAHWSNCMRQMAVDLRKCKKIKRRIKQPQL